ncbi:MAG TPA: hypothetical protein VNU21_23515 [Usitatibacter sp.]|nr:hypothetical protein [Usitatibacter sp.]
MRLSVLSALARMNLDPWEEAARLAALPTSDAEGALVATLNLLPGHPQKSSETEILAARLVALLPKAGTTAKVAIIVEGRQPPIAYWLVLLCISIAVSLLSAHQRATTRSAGDSGSASNAAPGASVGAKPAPYDVNRRADPVPAALPQD